MLLIHISIVFVIPSHTQQEDVVIGEEFKKKWEEFQGILERQKEKGGVIDPEAESNRFLIHINEVNSGWNIFNIFLF